MSGGTTLIFTEKMKDLFVVEFAKCGLKWKAAAVCGVDYETVRLHQIGDPAFKTKVDAALEVYRECLETAAHARAVDGVETDIIHRGEVVGTKIEYSDTLLLAMLKRHIPEYRDKGQLDVHHSGGVLVVPLGEESAEEWVKKNQ